MSNLKKDITQILANLYSQAYADGAVGHSRNDDILTAHKEIINLIEKSEQKLLAKMTLDCKTVDYQGEQWNAILVKKLKNITFEQDEDIPNGAWGKNSLKKDIDEAVNKISKVNQLIYAEYDFRYGDGSGNTKYDVEKLHQLRKKALKYHTTQIINLIESVIPEPDKHTWRAYGQPDGTVVCDHCNLAEDVNNLLSSQVTNIKSKLINGEGLNGTT